MKQTNSSASSIVLNFSGTSYITPLVGAMLGDSFFGHFRSSLLFAVIYVVGQFLVTLSANVPALQPTQCKIGEEICPATKRWQLSFLYTSLFIIALGRAGYPAYQVLGAAQFHDHRQNAERSAFFTYMFQALTFGYMVSATAVVYVQESYGWGVGYILTALASFMSLLGLLSGLPFYREGHSEGNACAKIFQVLSASLLKCRLSLPPREELFDDQSQDPDEANLDFFYSSDFRFLDKAAIETHDEQFLREGRNPWRLCTLSQVEEVKQILRLVPVCISCIIFTSIYGQLPTLFVLQGEVMNRKVGNFNVEIPPATMTIFENLTVLLGGYLYNKVFIPTMMKVTGHPKGISPLQRIGTGLCMGVLAMTVAALVETQRLARISPSDTQGSEMSMFYLIPQFVLVGIGEIFTYVGLTEFFYDQSPPRMRSVSSSISMLTQAMGNYLSSLLVSIVYHSTTKDGSPGWIPNDLNEGRVDKFYLLLAALCGLSFICFLIIASTFKHRRDENLPTRRCSPMRKTMTSRSSLKEPLLS
ncbi:protein MpNPF32 [Marchantia polymorpha subsp. ruderalis]|nr:hypothetical protein MARPO_0013s0195 [Marchantia polymorpha]BBN18841.1 hypothetical protein Mp_8g05950 [Marchantia polymorpha subsp. ruderalis]|eukprot:PTQ46003.1 hypothetical protein MARPO_0013s0195 [Marchantia polymorpha]